MELFILQCITFMICITSFIINFKFIDFEENLPLKLTILILILGIIFSIFAMPLFLIIVLLFIGSSNLIFHIGRAIFLIKMENKIRKDKKYIINQ